MAEDEGGGGGGEQQHKAEEAVVAVEQESAAAAAETQEANEVAREDTVAHDELVATLRSQIDELNNQVTSLNQKLVQSYDRVGDLEDDLHEHRQTATQLKARVIELEQDKAKWDKEIEAGGWVERNDVQVEMQRLMSQVMTETQNKDEAVKKHENLSAEIDNLTSSLFSEANKMVAIERMARAKAEDKMRTLEESSSTMSNLFEELQQSLRERVRDLEDKEKENAELKRKLADLAGDSQGAAEDEGSTEDGAVVAAFSDGKSVTPAQTPRISRPATPKPTVRPPRLVKALPYQEFLAFVAYLRQLRVSVLSRPPESPHTPYTSAAAFAAARNFGNTSSPATPPLGLSPAQLMAPHLPLSSHSSQPFIKRSIEEDSDPTVRLDFAPGLGMFSRRTISSAIVDGNLMIEPVASGSTLPSLTCALCGTSLERWWKGAVADQTATKTVRKVFGSTGWSFGSTASPTSKKESPRPGAPGTPPAVPTKDDESSFTYTPTIVEGDHHVQLHTFRSGDSASTKYPLCPNYCLPRLRSVCEFWNYVRVVERSLLLEDSFKIKDNAEYDHKRNFSQTSLRSDRAMASADSLALPPSSSTAPVKAETEGTSAEPEEEKNVESTDEKPTGETDKSADGSHDSGDEARKSSDESRKSMEEPANEEGNSEAMARSASGNAAKPPLPKRSAARTPALKSSEFAAASTEPVEREQPQASYPLLPSPNLPATVPRPRITTNTNSSSMTTATVETIVGSATGWEDRCWTELVRLKEDLFWHRMPATEIDGRAVTARGARFD